MARIPFATRNDVLESERAAYDDFLQKRGGRPNAGPYAILLHMPQLAQKLESLRLYIREEKSLPQALQELVMLTVAREMDCAYIWYAHAAAARAAGVRDYIVDSIRGKQALTGLEPDEQLVVDFARELLRSRKVSQPTFDRASASFGRRGTLTLTNLIACYAALAYLMNACELEAPAHATEQALPV
ncbi:MAG TPA: carboxymuconolactone decarboxylase family protein [Burkholderiales bacterium]|nr:carboxymuconolactone decarboxylase family protein [Burkholderiales bacterium]